MCHSYFASVTATFFSKSAFLSQKSTWPVMAASIMPWLNVSAKMLSGWNASPYPVLKFLKWFRHCGKVWFNIQYPWKRHIRRASAWVCPTRRCTLSPTRPSATLCSPWRSFHLPIWNAVNIVCSDSFWSQKVPSYMYWISTTGYSDTFNNPQCFH